MPCMNNAILIDSSWLYKFFFLALLHQQGPSNTMVIEGDGGHSFLISDLRRKTCNISSLEIIFTL